MNASRLDENDAVIMKTVNQAETIRLFEDSDLGMLSNPCSNQILSAESTGVSLKVMTGLLFSKMSKEKITNTNMKNIKIHSSDVKGENIVDRWLVLGCTTIVISVDPM